jgi:hypothetical protein
MDRRILALSAAALLLTTAYAGELKPEHEVRDHSVVSAQDPKVIITLPASATHVGSARWILQAYFDDIELHAFVEADAKKRVTRLYWLQFEAYLPSHPEYHHTYDSTRHVTMGGMDFLVDTWTGNTDSQDEPDSDTAHLKAALSSKGYSLPRSMMTVRFVHLMDGARKELMYIYKEAPPGGLTADDLKQGGKAYGQWPGIEKDLIERAEKSVDLR